MGSGDNPRQTQLFLGTLQLRIMMICIIIVRWASQVVLVVKDLPASAGDLRDIGSIPELGRSPEEGQGNPL